MSKNIKRISPVKSHAALITSWMKEPGFKAEYNALEEEYQLLREMLTARKRAGLTQADVAEKMGTQAPAIARLETSFSRSKHSPSLSTLRKYAEAVGCRLEIHFKPATKISRSKHI
jgi:DNA-binding XRE family transcriptional regulator